MQLKCIGTEAYSQVRWTQLHPWGDDDICMVDHVLAEAPQTVEQKTYFLHVNNVGDFALKQMPRSRTVITE